jgi:hypothetical protein
MFHRTTALVFIVQVLVLLRSVDSVPVSTTPDERRIRSFQYELTHRGEFAQDSLGNGQNVQLIFWGDGGVFAVSTEHVPQHFADGGELMQRVVIVRVDLCRGCVRCHEVEVGEEVEVFEVSGPGWVLLGLLWGGGGWCFRGGRFGHGGGAWDCCFSIFWKGQRTGWVGGYGGRGREIKRVLLYVTVVELVRTVKVNEWWGTTAGVNSSTIQQRF